MQHGMMCARESAIPSDLWGRRCLPLSPAFSTQPLGIAQVAKVRTKRRRVNIGKRPGERRRWTRFRRSDDRARVHIDGMNFSVVRDAERNTELRVRAPMWNAAAPIRRSETVIPDAKIDHVAIAVHDVARAIPIYADAFGARYLFGGDNTRQGFRWAQFTFPNGGKVEFVAPLTPDGFVARFLAARGEGVHHITLKTEDIASALAAVRAGGLEPVMVNIEGRDWKEAFIHPKQALGVLIQIAQSQFADDDVAKHHLSDHSRSDHRHLAFEDLGSGR